MVFRRFTALKTVIALIAWVAPLIVTPVHLYEAHSYHNDCPACRAEKERPHQNDDASCRGECDCHHREANTKELPPQHNHEFQRLGEYCSTCEILFGQNKILSLCAVGTSDFQTVARLLVLTQSVAHLECSRAGFSRAPPA